MAEPRGRSAATAIAACLLVVAVACSADPGDPGPSEVVEVEGMMPPLDVTTLDGETLSDADLAGRPVVVNFWATWCDPCEREQPMLVRAHEDRGGDVAFLGVDYRDQDDAARDWLARYEVPYPNVADPTGQLATRFGVTTGLPTTIVVDADGRLRFRVLGELDRETLDSLLGRVAEG